MALRNEDGNYLKIDINSIRYIGDFQYNIYSSETIRRNGAGNFDITVNYE